MGSASSVGAGVISQEKTKPVDASDINNLEQAKAEISRMRKLVATAPARELCYNPVSFNCHGPWLLVLEGKTGHSLRVLDMMKGEHMTPEFLAINPLHCVPTLVDEEGAIVESNAIMRYMCAKYNLADRFYPSNLKDRSRVDMALDFRQTSLYPSVAAVVYPKLGFASPDPPKEAAKAKVLKEKFLPHLENVLLKGRKFVGGDLPCIADFAIVPPLSVLAGVTDVALPQRLQDYLVQFSEAAPSFAQVFGAMAGFMDMVKAKAQTGGQQAAEAPAEEAAGAASGSKEDGVPTPADGSPAAGGGATVSVPASNPKEDGVPTAADGSPDADSTNTAAATVATPTAGEAAAAVAEPPAAAAGAEAPPS